MKEIIKLPNGRTKVITHPEGETMTQRQFQEDTDVNKIMQKYKKLGQITHINSKTGVYADITEIGSYDEALHKVLRANSAFNDLPSVVRNRFANDPQQLISFLADPRNDDEARKLGLIVTPKTQEPAPQAPEVK